jgi:hypothetical protein
MVRQRRCDGDCLLIPQRYTPEVSAEGVNIGQNIAGSLSTGKTGTGEIDVKTVPYRRRLIQLQCSRLRCIAMRNAVAQRTAAAVHIDVAAPGNPVGPHMYVLFRLLRAEMRSDDVSPAFVLLA